jgi:hypothetical protein
MLTERVLLAIIVIGSISFSKKGAPGFATILSYIIKAKSVLHWGSGRGTEEAGKVVGSSRALNFTRYHPLSKSLLELTVILF